jgi:hypothetical protein
MGSYEAERAITSPPTLSESFSTPQKVNQLINLANSIQTQLDDVVLPSPLRRNLDKFLRSSLTQAQAGALAEETLLKIKVAEAARAARAKRTRRTVITGGVITVQEARVRISERQKTTTRW